jgi:hypothetical protein
MKIDGRCHCGYITFEAEADPDKATVCHCTDCQSLSGSAFRTVVRAADGSFRILSGEPTVYVKTADSGTKRAQGFCPRCGSPIYATGAGDSPKTYSVRLGTVRQRDQFAPRTQVWTRSRQRWVNELASVRSVETP